MHKKIIILIVFLSIICSVGFAKQISFGEAHRIAYNWVEILRSEFREDVAITPGSGRVITKNGIESAYIFDFEKKGFLVISAEDYMTPVKFYNTSFDFGEHEQAQFFQDRLFTELSETIRDVRKRKRESDQTFGNQNREFFQFLKGYHKHLQNRPAADKEEVEPLIRTKWGQTAAENLKCPVIEGRRAPSGCVATAIAQIMYYHEWPIRGRGSRSYVEPVYNIPLSANFDHEYDWKNMLFEYQHENYGTEEERNAIATLMFDVGVSLEMFYTPTWSSADIRKRAVFSLPEYFMYSNEIELVDRFGYSNSEWFSLAKGQVDQGLPIAFSIFSLESGHEVIIDGYRVFEKSQTVHINFGWSGIDDGYYSIVNIPDFEKFEQQWFLLNIKPPHYRYIKAPGNISAVCYRNQSLLLTEYHVRITWDETPTGDENIEKYIIYRKERKLRTNKSAHHEKIGEVAVGQERVFKIITPHFDQWQYYYTVIAADAKGNKSKNPQWIKVEPIRSQ